MSKERSGVTKKITKGMRDKGGYWYKNETLIERKMEYMIFENLDREIECVNIELVK